MPYSFTPTIKPFAIACLYESIKAARPNTRLPNTSYSLGAQVVNAYNRYIAIQAGVSGAGAGPTTAAGTINDGTVRWLAMGSDQIEDGSILSNLYVGLGKNTEWANPSVPPAPDTSYDGERAALSAATAFIRLDATNLRAGIKNNVWTSGTIYSEYDPSINYLGYATPFYSITSGGRVYKCLDNNNGAASTVAPTGSTYNQRIETADNYIWTYVGAISNTDQFDFATAEFVPAPAQAGRGIGGAFGIGRVTNEISSFNRLQTVGNSFGAAAALSVLVIGPGTGATAAARTTTAGPNKTVTNIYSTVGGENYDDKSVAVVWDTAALGSGATTTPTVAGGAITSFSMGATGSAYANATVLIVGDGTGATATATVVGGAVTSITVGNGGTGYTWARAVIVPGQSGAIARAVLSPVGGHGSNLATELGTRALLISTKLTPALASYIPTSPAQANGTFRQVTLVSGVQGESTSVRNAPAYLGKAHVNYATAENLNKYKDGSGFVLYVNNIAAITHTSTQEEIIKISISL